MELSHLKRAHALRRANDMMGAFAAYLESATQDNDANAHAWLSTCYLMGHGTDMNPEKAFEHASKSSAASNPLGQNNLGYCLQHGLGTKPDHQTAFRMYQESAATGNPLAFNNLGICLSSGTGCAQDLVAAAQNFKKSAALGDSFGMNSLGNAYYTGQGVPRDYVEAFNLFVAASEKGNLTGTFNLACCYLTGHGTSVNTEVALGLFETAANGGVPAAQYRMGCMCRDGIGCPIDVDRARGYFQLAADQAHSKASSALKAFEEMSSSGVPKPDSESFRGDMFTPIVTGHHKASFETIESANMAISLSPPFEESHLTQREKFETISKKISAMELELLQTMGNIRHQGAEQAISGVSQQNLELLKAAGAIHKRYEAKVTTALKEFRREITELEQQFSMRRVQEALDESAASVSPQPLSLPAAGTLKSKHRGFKSRPF